MAGDCQAMRGRRKHSLNLREAARRSCNGKDHRRAIKRKRRASKRRRRTGILRHETTNHAPAAIYGARLLRAPPRKAMRRACRGHGMAETPRPGICPGICNRPQSPVFWGLYALACVAIWLCLRLVIAAPVLVWLCLRLYGQDTGSRIPKIVFKSEIWKTYLTPEKSEMGF